MSGILAGRNAVRRAEGKPTGCPNGETMSGALTRYISDESVKHFQPMGANMGILPPLPAESRPRDKRLRYMAQAERAVASFQHWLERRHQYVPLDPRCALRNHCRKAARPEGL